MEADSEGLWRCTLNVLLLTIGVISDVELEGNDAKDLTDPSGLESTVCKSSAIMVAMAVGIG